MEFCSVDISPSFNLVFLSIGMLSMFSGLSVLAKWFHDLFLSADMLSMLNMFNAFGNYILVGGGGVCNSQLLKWVNSTMPAKGLRLEI